MPDHTDRAGQTIHDLLGAARTRLEQVGIGSAALDARVLLEHVLSKSQVWLRANSNAVVSRSDLDCFDQLIARRAEREPVSQITGRREFWSLDFEVTGDVLTPRPDSETLIEAVLDHHRQRDTPLRILDLGTGSGCLLLSLLSEFSTARGVGVDVSPAALQVAVRNGRNLNLDDRVDWMLGSWETQFDAHFDVVISNPPYIETAALAGLARDVFEYEPHLALDGGPDGLDPYRAILNNVGNLMGDEGVLFVEFGEGQADAISKLAAPRGLNRGVSYDDLSGVTRVLKFQWQTIG